ncbi:hypothetical protein AB0L35_07815 [Streptomyces sp. NPDC052309]|uniref:Coenzyme PQQ synthesis protein A n=1 Tax=Streptomyces griseicoloratus TaxID=2752516 RepID=A0A926L346_9ACTN|nr:hypothetical protein [Streptomyces griseicoloratus]MBD0421667.1 hypothetical protein [Streptomyces griseicoloratus]
MRSTMKARVRVQSPVRRQSPARPAARTWIRPEYQVFDTPMEVTAYAGRA